MMLKPPLPEKLYFENVAITLATILTIEIEHTLFLAIIVMYV